MGLVQERIRGSGLRVLLALPLALGACSTTPQESVSGESVRPSAPASATIGPTPGQSGSDPSAAPLPIFEKLTGVAWIGESPEGWLAGELGESYRRLPEDEVGILAKDNWILSIRYPKEEGLGVTLLIRRNSGADAAEVQVGDLVPGSIAVAKDMAFISGASFSGDGDLRVFGLNLADPPANPDPLLKADAGSRVRTLAISSDGGRLASSICDVIDDFEIGGCRLEILPTEPGEATPIGDLPGMLSRITPEVGIVADPAADSEPAWVAGFELESGKQLWQVDGQIETWRLIGDRQLVLSRFQSGDDPRFILEAVDVRTGERHTLFEQDGDTPPRFWADQSSDDYLVLSNASDIATAVAEHPDGLVPVLIVDLSSGSVDPFLLYVGKAA